MPRAALSTLRLERPGSLLAAARSSCNRSKPHVDVLRAALGVLRNICRWVRPL
jgi:hypothetical protein